MSCLLRLWWVQKLLAGIMLLGLLGFLSGCKDQAAASNDSRLTVTVQPSVIKIAPGQTASLTLNNPNTVSVSGIQVSLNSINGVSIQGNCSSIPAQGQCILMLTAAPSTGNQTGTINISGGNINAIAVPLKIAIPLNPALSVDKGMLALYQNIGVSDTLTLTNSGNVPLSGITLSNLPQGVSASDGCTALPVGQSCTFSFSADNNSTIGSYPQVLLKATEINPVQLNIQISPENQGPTATSIAVSTDSLLITKGTSQSITLTNTGNNAINGNLVIHTEGLNSGDVSVIPNLDCTNLAPNSSCMVAINTTANSQNYNAEAVIFSASNATNTASVAVSVGSPNLYLDHNTFSIETGGNLNIEVHNGNDFAATNVRLANLPAGVTASTCASLPAQGSCILTLQADSGTVQGSNTITIQDDQSSSLLTFTLEVNPVMISSNNLDQIIYVPIGGSSNSITVSNNSSETSAQNVKINNLPDGLTANTCGIIAPQESCTITITAAEDAVVTTQPVDITVAGENTNSLNGNMVVEQPSLSLSSVNFTGPGNITVTVTNQSHFEVTNIQPEVQETNGISISDNACSTLAGQGSDDSPNSCTFNLSATGNAQAYSGAQLKVTGEISGLPELSATTPVVLAAPTVTLNNSQSIILSNLNADTISVPVTVAAGDFNLQNPHVSLTLSNGNDSKVNVAFKDSNNQEDNCPNPLLAGNSCTVTLTNTAALDSLGDGNLTVSGDNLSPTVQQNVNIVGGLAINYLNAATAADYYPRSINGPHYGVILLQNMGSNAAGDSTFTINSLDLTGTAAAIVPRGDTANDPAYGNHLECVSTGSDSYITSTLAPGTSCIIVLKSIEDNSIGTQPGSLDIIAGSTPNIGVASHTFTLTSTGYLYAGGSFTMAGDITANRVAKWDGNAWSPLGFGINSGSSSGYVGSFAIDSAGNLYAGGSFAKAGEIEANAIAKWDGNTWSPLSSGMNSDTYSMAFDSAGNLYAGGYFTEAGDNTIDRIAKWDGSIWSPLSSGMNDYVRSVIFDSAGNLYAGGRFTMAGGNTANRIAKWDGSTWSTLDSGIGNAYIISLIFDSAGNLYAGGGFTQAGGNTANYIAKWDGSTWSPLGSGMNNYVNALAFDSTGNLYASGAFTLAGGNTVNYIAKWDGSTWSPLGSGMNNYVSSLAFDSAGNLYAGGAFTQADGNTANRIAKWDGSAWSPLSSGMNDEVSFLTIDRILKVQ